MEQIGIVSKAKNRNKLDKEHILYQLLKSRQMTKNVFLKIYWSNNTNLHSYIVIKNMCITSEIIEQFIISHINKLKNGYNSYYKTDSYYLSKYEILEQNSNLYANYPKWLQ